MKFNSPFYYCSECKTILSSIAKLLFVEDKSTKGFCSEACIEDFYLPLIRHFENVELNLRKDLGLENERSGFSFVDKNMTEEIIANNDEIWKMNNELGEEIYSYIKYFDNYSGIVICKVINGVASFVFLSTATNSNKFLAEVRTGEKIVLNNSTDGLDESIDNRESGLSEDDYIFMQLLENKKSKLLAELLIKRKEDDVPFEEFDFYESCFPETLEEPDEVYENRDNEGDVYFIYIKSFLKKERNIFYIISCLKKKEVEDNLEINVFPVLAFPTNDLNLYSDFRTGKKISGPLKN